MNIGMCHGDYFVMPILGPVFARDLVAEPISWFMDPVSYFIGIPWVIAKYAVYQINYRALNFEMIDSVKKSEDVYSTWKGMYTQKYGDQSEIDDSPSPDK